MLVKHRERDLSEDSDCFQIINRLQTFNSFPQARLVLKRCLHQQRIPSVHFWGLFSNLTSTHSHVLLCKSPLISEFLILWYHLWRPSSMSPFPFIFQDLQLNRQHQFTLVHASALLGKNRNQARLCGLRTSSYPQHHLLRLSRDSCHHSGFHCSRSRRAEILALSHTHTFTELSP